MDPEAFAYWLQGHVELNPNQKQPTQEQWKMIKEHLALVFTKVTPPLQPFDLKRKGPPFDVPWTSPEQPPYKVTCDLKTLTIC